MGKKKKKKAYVELPGGPIDSCEVNSDSVQFLVNGTTFILTSAQPNYEQMSRLVFLALSQGRRIDTEGPVDAITGVTVYS